MLLRARAIHSWKAAKKKFSYFNFDAEFEKRFNIWSYAGRAWPHAVCTRMPAGLPACWRPLLTCERERCGIDTRQLWAKNHEIGGKQIHILIRNSAVHCGLLVIRATASLRHSPSFPMRALDKHIKRRQQTDIWKKKQKKKHSIPRVDRNIYVMFSMRSHRLWMCECYTRIAHASYRAR